MGLKEIVEKLVGSITPAGESHLDTQRFENLKVMCHLIEELVMEVNYVSRNKDRHESSMAVMGEYADKFLRNLSDDIKNI